MIKLKNTKPATAANAYAGFGDILAGGFDTSLTDSANDQMVALDRIEVRMQDRVEFEDEDNTLAELGRSLAKKQLQSILLRHSAPGAALPFILVAGERRVRAAKVQGLTQLRARIEEMTEDEAQEAQLAENIHRKNLTQIEEAKRLQRDIEQLGSVEAVVAKHHKSRSWVSKTIALLTLPESARRLVAENISADLEVISQVKTIEKIDPAAAKQLVDDLKATRGKESGRAKVQAVKEKVKPKPTALKAPAKQAATGETATAPNRSNEQPGEVQIFAHAKKGSESVQQVLSDAFTRIYESHVSPQSVVDAMKPEQLEVCEDWLHTFYEAGKTAKDVSRIVIVGLRNGMYAADGHGAFALAAFLYGADAGAKFVLVNVLASVKE